MCHGSVHHIVSLALAGRIHLTAGQKLYRRIHSSHTQARSLHLPQMNYLLKVPLSFDILDGTSKCAFPKTKENAHAWFLA